MRPCRTPPMTTADSRSIAFRNAGQSMYLWDASSFCGAEAGRLWWATTILTGTVRQVGRRRQP